MKKLLMLTLLITMAVAIKRVNRKLKKPISGQWSNGPHITLDTKKVEDYTSSVSSEMYF